ncbi:hypothetical protein [Erythrobacter rubeus]|uniref:DUF3073 domain-containing protein n=1 Tax=Erythrobacter rubeus TaxID=2760803 RepID=A0ABR8KSP4_9SPHN|nr:hypothetical protein [Erythrobacter rubeus]MBD2841459.1 hypothetical protein [Erythrobacter rubeus]
MAERRTEKQRKDAAIFFKKTGRKAQKGVEPNDRGYDHEFQKKLRRIRPEDFDRLINGDD